MLSPKQSSINTYRLDTFSLPTSPWRRLARAPLLRVCACPPPGIRAQSLKSTNTSMKGIFPLNNQQCWVGRRRQANKFPLRIGGICLLICIDVQSLWQLRRQWLSFIPDGTIRHLNYIGFSPLSQRLASEIAQIGVHTYTFLWSVRAIKFVWQRLSAKIELITVMQLTLTHQMCLFFADLPAAPLPTKNWPTPYSAQCTRHWHYIVAPLRFLGNRFWDEWRPFIFWRVCTTPLWIICQYSIGSGSLGSLLDL